MLKPKCNTADQSFRQMLSLPALSEFLYALIHHCKLPIMHGYFYALAVTSFPLSSLLSADDPSCCCLQAFFYIITSSSKSSFHSIRGGPLGLLELHTMLVVHLYDASLTCAFLLKVAFSVLFYVYREAFPLLSSSGNSSLPFLCNNVTIHHFLCRPHRFSRLKHNKA